MQDDFDGGAGIPDDELGGGPVETGEPMGIGEMEGARSRGTQSTRKPISAAPAQFRRRRPDNETKTSSSPRYRLPSPRVIPGAGMRRSPFLGYRRPDIKK